MPKKQAAPAVKQAKNTEPSDQLLARLTMFFFKRSGTAALIWLVIALFGIASYTTLLKREGFPSVNIPIVIVNGVYAVGDAEQVDRELAKPIANAALQQNDATSVMSQSEANFFTVTIQYKETVKGSEAKKQLQKDVEAIAGIPAAAKLQYNAPYFGVTGPTVDRVDATISVYDTTGSLSLEELTAKAEQASKELNAKNLNQVEGFKVADPFEAVTNPETQQSSVVQRSFDRYGLREDRQNSFYQSVIINVTGVDGYDVLKMDKALEEGLAELNKTESFQDVKLAISASNAPTINDSISELQRVLLEGLLAVLVIGSIIIAIRASLIIVLAMISVLLATVGLLFLLDYSLNVITLFGLILSLSLIVDDTIIMTEAIDAARRKNKQASKAVEQATRKISRAMVAATLTAALSFAPLIFVGGILGSFIRAIPVTIISALLISLFTALILIPLFAKYLLLGKKQMGEGNVKEVAAGIEEKIASFIAKPMAWARHSRPKEIFVGLAAIFISLGFIIGGGIIFRNGVEFNIFPPTKDTNQIAVAITYAPGTSIAQAEAIADQVDEKVQRIIGSEFVQGSYYGIANDQSATLYIELTSYSKRDITAPSLVKEIDSELKSFGGARADAYTVDVGPPAAGFTINIDATNREAAIKLANDMAAYLNNREFERENGKKAKMVDVNVSNTAIYARSGNASDDKTATPVIKVTANFNATDISALTDPAQQVVIDKFNAATLASYGLEKDAISFDLGQESENQESFNTLGYAFPAVLLVIYFLLAIQFRSLLQPLIIFMAIPFSFFGIALGLDLTDNAFSFFTMLGFFALIGLSIKNTILLTDYANQARRAGAGPVDAAIEALRERFRPLIATSLTAVVSLIPLAITSPFWEALAVVLIGGLLSSTFLVVTVFPYYYLGAEYLRQRISRKLGLSLFILTIALAVLLGKVGGPIILAPVIAFIIVKLFKVGINRSRA